MKAIRVLRPYSLKLIDNIPEPEPKPSEIVVKIAASGVCRSDLDIIEGKLDRVRYPLTIGHEAAGYIHTIGEDVQRKQTDLPKDLQLREGLKVAIYPTYGCGHCPYCLVGQENLCPHARAIGFEMDGSHAEFLLIQSPNHIFPIQNITPEEAAPLGCAGLTAYEAIKEYVVPRSRPGASVVVIGVGGLGHIAIQILRKLADVNIIAIDKYESKLKLAEELGADYVVNFTSNKNGDNRHILDEIREVSSDCVCAALDFVGNDSTLKLGYESLGILGILVVVGASGGTLSYRGPDAKRREVVGPIIGSLGSMRELLDIVERKEIKILYEQFPLYKIEEVIRKLKNGEILGRAVLTP